MEHGDQSGQVLHCLRCGYNLTGLPDSRCPECGFGFTGASVRSITELAVAERVRAFQRCVRWSLAALLLLVAPALVMLFLVAMARAKLDVSVFFVFGVAIFTVYCIVFRRFWHFLGLAAFITAMICWATAPVLVWLGSAGVFAVGIDAYFRRSEQFPEALDSATPQDAALLARWRRRAQVALGAGVVLLLALGMGMLA